MIDKLDIMKLNELPIEQVAQALGLSVNRHKALCPFHNDKHPSLTFSVSKNRYKCFVCDAHGGPIDLVMNYLHKTFLEACHWLSSMDPSTLNLQLTEHFKLSEFERSAKAAELGIDNSVPPHYLPVLQQLCREVLEPLRTFVGQPIVITSGYRCSQLNVKVGGAYASQHTLGEAADLKLPVTPYTAWEDNKQHTDLEEASFFARLHF